MRVREPSDESLRALERAVDRGDVSAMHLLAVALLRLRGAGDTDRLVREVLPAFILLREFGEDLTPREVVGLAVAEEAGRSLGWVAFVSQDELFNREPERAEFLYGMTPGQVAVNVELIDNHADAILNETGPFFIDEDDLTNLYIDDHVDPEELPSEMRVAWARMALEELGG